MANKKKTVADSTQVVESSAINTAEGGLATTAPVVLAPVEPAPSPDVDERDPMDDNVIYDEDQFVDEPEATPITVDQTISRDPMATPASCLLAIGRLYNDAEIASRALTHHLRKNAGEPELFSFLQRMQNALGDFRHMVEQVEAGLSEQLRDNIEAAVA